jgi:hypothetical protein
MSRRRRRSRTQLSIDRDFDARAAGRAAFVVLR